MKRIYIAGPISYGGTASAAEIETNLRAFHSAEQHLRGLDYVIYNPARLAGMYDDWASAMELAL